MSELTLNFGPVGVQRVGDVVLEKIPCIWMLGGEKKKTQKTKLHLVFKML